MKTTLINKTQKMSTIFNFETMQYTIYNNGAKEYTRKCQNIDELLNALSADVQRCEKRDFEFELINN
jgi:hypothetical protein